MAETPRRKPDLTKTPSRRLVATFLSRPIRGL
jgi:hypothetical protein